MAKAKTSTATVNTAVLAKYLGVSSRRVLQLVDDGVIDAVKGGTGNHYDLSVVIQQYIAHISNKSKSPDMDSEKKKLKADADYKRHKADMAGLQLEELRGNMHRSEDVEAAMTDIVYAIRGALVALPGRVAIDALKAKTAAEVSKVVRTEINKALEELSEYRYDPEFFKERVRERAGWSDADREEE